MYFTYLRRELSGRKKQTAIVAIGLAIAIALVMVVNALSAGVSAAQSQTLASVYGVGTDLTVTGAATEPGTDGGGRGQQFDFGADAGATESGTTSLSASRLMADRMRGTLAADTVTTVSDITGVAAATGTLSLTNSTFSGELPQRSQDSTGTTPDGAAADGGTQTGPGVGGTPPQGGPDEAGGSSFGIDTFSVLGIDPSVTDVGPMTSVSVAEGRLLDASDSEANVAVLDAAYASSNAFAVGGTIDVGGTEMTIVGTVNSSSSAAETAGDVFIPLTVAQTLSGSTDQITTVYVQAESAAGIADVQAALAAELPETTVNSQADLASTVSGSLSSATSLITNLGTWLSILVLAVALLLSVLLTISGVTRRTREFGTLKALGWSQGRVISQVAGESLVQGLIGGAIGLVLGLGAIIAINVISPTISAASSSSGPDGAMPGGGGMGGRFGGIAQAAADITLSAPITLWVILAAIGTAVAGGLLAGAFGGWRAARLAPSEALRAVA